MTDWIAKNVAKVIAIAVVALLLVGLVALHECSSARTAHTETKLATGQTGAALDSGTDAVGTVGNRMEADAAGDALTANSAAEIRNAPGAEATVAAPVVNAGIAALCRRNVYKDTPRCAH